MLISNCDERDLSETLTAYRQSLPSRAGIIVFYLIGEFVDEMDSEEERSHRKEFLVGILREIRNQRGFDVDEEWLKESKAMLLLYDYQRHDLLVEFTKALEGAVRNGYVHEARLVESVQEQILSLRAKRDLL